MTSSSKNNRHSVNLIGDVRHQPCQQTGVRVLTTVSLPTRRSHTASNDPGCVNSRLVSFELTSGEHVALVVGDCQEQNAPLVRVHSECLTGDVFGSARCDCGPQLQEAIHLMAEQGGVVLYLRQEGRGIGLYNKIEAYRLQEQGLTTYEANLALNQPEDSRDFGVAAAMLQALGITRCRLMTNNPDKRRQLQEGGIEVVEQYPTGVYLTQANRLYLEAKVRHGNHQLLLPVIPESGSISSARYKEKS